MLKTVADILAKLHILAEARSCSKYKNYNSDYDNKNGRDLYWLFFYFFKEKIGRF